MDNKITLRIKAKNIRKTLELENINKSILLNIRNNNAYKQAKNIMIYYPLKNEINLLPLLEDNKKFYLPRVSDENIECCRYKKNDKLIKSSFNVLEPVCQKCSPDILDIVFVPALAANINGCRLGYGKGCYDRFLKNCRALKIIAIPDELIFDSIPQEKHDISCDVIITQKKASFERG